MVVWVALSSVVCCGLGLLDAVRFRDSVPMVVVWILRHVDELFAVLVLWSRI